MYCSKLLHKEAILATWQVRAQLARMRLMFKYKILFPEELVDGHNNLLNVDETQSGQN